MIFTTDMLLQRYREYANPYDKIKRECRNGNLIKVIRGLYEDDPKAPPYLLASYIYGPSYISFEYVLSQTGLIPEYAVNVTSATFRKNRSKEYRTPFGVFIYRDVPKAVFREGAEFRIEKGYVYTIASPERALCDELYIVPQSGSYAEFKELLFDDLRIDRSALETLDKEEIFRIAPLYRHANHDYLCRYLKRG